MIQTGDAADLAALARLRDQMNEADNTGNADAFATVLADDVVIMAPGMPPLVGRETCLTFVREVFLAYPKRHLQETINEVEISGDIAFDRASFVQVVDDPELGRPVRECGICMRIYRRSAEGWRAARVIWHAEVDHDGETSAPA